MPEGLSNMIEFISKVWMKLNPVQRAKIMLTGVSSILLFAVIIFVVTRPQMERLQNEAMTPERIAEIETILTGSGIEYKVSNGYIDVKRDQLGSARLALEGADIGGDFDYKDMFATSSLGKTELEQHEMRRKAKQTELEEMLKGLRVISGAEVELSLPKKDVFYINEQNQSSASVTLSTVGSLSKKQIEGIVDLVQKAVDGLEKENISIIDNSANILYSGRSDEEGMDLSEQQKVQLDTEKMYEKKVQDLLKQRFDDINVVVSLEMDFDKVVEQKIEYTSPIDGSKKGLITKENLSSQSSENRESGGEPGLGSNDGTSLNQASGAVSKDETENKNIDYAINSSHSEIKKATGTVNKGNSSLAVTAYKYVRYRQETMENSGELEGSTWEEFKIQKMSETLEKINIDSDVLEGIKSATGIQKLTISAYMKPTFINTLNTKKPMDNFIFIGIMFVLVALFVYALIKKSEPEEIISVDSSLALKDLVSGSGSRPRSSSNATSAADEEPLDNIEVKDSRVKKQVEKFADEKPEAVAQLLKNWLSDEWE